MVATRLVEENFTKPVANERDQRVRNAKDQPGGKYIGTEPTLHSWMIVAAGSVVPLGVAIAAAITTRISSSERVGVTAWVAVAVVGTASVISTAVAARRRVKSVLPDEEDARSLSIGDEVSTSNT